MRPGDVQLSATLNQRLTDFDHIRRLPGIDNPAARSCFIEQIIDSVRRVRYVTLIRDKNHDPQIADPLSVAFDPIKAAAFHIQNGNREEAFWLVFVATHFGRNLRTGWQLVRNVYGRLGHPDYWNWRRISANVSAFRDWLGNNGDTVKENGKFGNHRKYESINAYENTGTGNAIASYVNWIGDGLSQNTKFINICNENDNNIRRSFSAAYNSMNAVARFGRTARFDYLTMVGKLGLSDIEPNSTYMNGATGPFRGAQLLFGVNETQTTFNEWLNDLEAHLGLYFGMQVLEDSLCNWQKSPTNYLYFGG